MAASPAPPEIERDARKGLDEIPVARTELEPPYRVLLHNNDDTNAI